MEALPIISVLSTSAVAGGAIWAGVWQQRRGFGHDREMADRESVRASLVETAALLHRAEYAVDEVNSAVFGHADTIADPEHPERREPIDRLEKVGRELDQAIGLVRVQLGPESSATKALEDAGAACLEVWRKSRRIRLANDRNAAVVGKRNDRLIEEVEQARADSKEAVRRFVERAHAIAGARLPDLVDRSRAE